MSHDVVADGLNVIKNAKRAGKETVEINRISNLLIEILKIMKQRGAVKKYKIDSKKRSVEISIGDLSECKAIKPRFNVSKDQIDKYVRRYLPAKNFVYLIISTNKGLMTHNEAIEKNIGGSLIAYVF